MGTKTLVSRTLTLAAGLFIFTACWAQDITLKLNIAEGQEKPRASEHKLVAGTETPLYAGKVYRILVTPTVASGNRVTLALKVLDVESNKVVSSPMIMVTPGAISTSSMASDPPSHRDLKYDISIDL